MRLFYIRLLFSFNKNYIFFFKISTFWQVCNKNIYFNFNILNLRAYYYVNIILSFIFICKKTIVNPFYSNLKLVSNYLDSNVLSFYYNFYNFLDKEITLYFLKKRNILDLNSFFYIYNYYFLMCKHYYIAAISFEKKKYQYFFFLKQSIFCVYFNLFLHKLKYTHLLLLASSNNNFFKKIILVNFFKNYYKHIIFYIITRF